MGYRFQIKHMPSRYNQADYISRYPLPTDKHGHIQDGEEILQELFDGFLVSMARDLYEPELMKVYKFLKREPQAFQSKSFMKKVSNHFVANGNLYKRIKRDDRVVNVPLFLHERSNLLKEIHEGYAHMDENTSWTLLYSKYWWPMHIMV